MIRIQYNNGLPPDSRFATEKEAQFDQMRQWLTSPEGQADIAKVKELSAFAENGQSLSRTSHLQALINDVPSQSLIAKSNTLLLHGSAQSSTHLR